MNHPLGFLLQFFTVVNKHNVVQVRITCGLGSSVSEEFTVCIFRRHSEDGDSLFPQNSIHSKLFCVRGRKQSQCLLDCNDIIKLKGDRVWF